MHYLGVAIFYSNNYSKRNSFSYSAAAPIVPLYDNFSIGPNVAPLLPLNAITGSTLDWFVSHQLTITLSMLASTSKSVELSCSDQFVCVSYPPSIDALNTTSELLLSVSLLPHTTYTFSSDVAMTAGRAFDGFDSYPIAFWSSIAVVPIIFRAI